MKKSYTNIGGISFAFMMTVFSAHTQAQTRIISGTITADSQPISGVSISQLNSDQTAISNSKGV